MNHLSMIFYRPEIRPAALKQQHKSTKLVIYYTKKLHKTKLLLLY